MIPIYRAKKIDSDEWVEGYFAEIFTFATNKFEAVIVKKFNDSEMYYQIDPNTLAIHFPNMIDKSGKKIFSSLSEDGVGGDIIEYDYAETTTERIMKVINGCVFATAGQYMEYMYDLLIEGTYKDIKVIGIHKGEESCK